MPQYNPRAAAIQLVQLCYHSTDLLASMAKTDRTLEAALADRNCLSQDGTRHNLSEVIASTRRMPFRKLEGTITTMVADFYAITQEMGKLVERHQGELDDSRLRQLGTDLITQCFYASRLLESLATQKGINSASLCLHDDFWAPEGSRYTKEDCIASMEETSATELPNTINTLVSDLHTLAQRLETIAKVKTSQASPRYSLPSFETGAADTRSNWRSEDVELA